MAAPISRSKRFSKAAQNSPFGASLTAGIEDPSKLQNAIEFIEGPSGIGIVLRPVQRVIVKSVFGVPFDFHPAWADRIPGWGMVPMYDVFRDKKVRPDVTEAEYLNIAYNEGRCNLRDWRDIPNVGELDGGFNEAVVFAGRRGGKALYVNTPVPTTNGWKTMGTVNIGDFVFDEQGNAVKVTQATEWMYDHTCYRVIFSTGESIIADAGHLWTTQDHPNVHHKEWYRYAEVSTTQNLANSLIYKDAYIPSSPFSKDQIKRIISIVPCKSVPVRCIQVKSASKLFLVGKGFVPTHNSELVAAIACYKLYTLLNVRSPQEHFGLFPGSIIDFTFLAQDESGSHRLFKKLREQVLKASSFFGPFLKDANAKDLAFVTLADREKQELTPTVTVSCLPCTTNAVRSPSSIFLALDEFAHFRSAKGSTSDDMYAAATPATADFHHEKVVKNSPEPVLGEVTFGSTFGEEPNEVTEEKEFEDKNETVGIQDSMILSISSPLKKIGKMYELHRLALDEGVSSGIFTLNCPSAEMNPKLLPKFLKSAFKKNPLTFKNEYGGKFLESSESYVTEQAVKDCTDVQWDDKGLPILSTARYNVTRFTPSSIGRNYFWGFDLGMTNDASALAVAHLEPGGPNGAIRLVYDYIDRMMVGEAGEWPGVSNLPGEQKYLNYQELPLSDILHWLRAVNQSLPCFRGATDQHGGQQLVQLLALNEIKNVELVNITPAINSQMAYVLRGYIENKLCSFPYQPKFIQELKLVELEVAARYQIRVAAPQEKGAHDDMADAAMLCAYLAQRWLIEEGNLTLDPSGISMMLQAQMYKSPAPLLSMDGVSMSTLRVMEKLKNTDKKANTFSGTSPVSPWSRRGRR